MFQRSLLVAGIAAAFLSTGSVAAPAEDIRCLVLSNAYATGASKEEAKKVAQSVSYFYAGKIDGVWTDEKLRAEIGRQRASLKPATSGPEMQACARRVESSLRRLMALSPKKN